MESPGPCSLDSPPLAEHLPPPASVDDQPGLSPALEAFLADSDVATPYVVIDVDVVADRYHSLHEALPTAGIYYAVKANPGVPVLERLAALGSSFDVASRGEIDLCLSLGISPDRLSFGNTIKKSADIAYAHSVGVETFAIDSHAELDKIAQHAPGATLMVRLRHDSESADWPLSRKFGCDADDAVDLIRAGAAMGSRVGLSFHVGSQQRDVESWDDAFVVIERILDRLGEDADEVQFLNLGGGFPASYVGYTPPVGDYGGAITEAVQRRFAGRDLELMVEPGRYLVGDAGVLRSEVVLVSRRTPDVHTRWVYLDVGKFHGLAETIDEAIRYRVRTSRDGGKTGPSVLAGPTCDSVDVLYEKNPYQLPLDLMEGDTIDFLSTGAYTTTYSSVGFNGFAPLAEYFVDATGRIESSTVDLRGVVVDR